MNPDSIPDGGPAFLHTRVHTDTSGTRLDGLSARDYFAAKALAGLMVRRWEDPETGILPPNIMQVWAASAYALADAMLKARKS